MSAATRRAVVLVGSPAAPYSRGLRIARTLAAEGFDVEIAAITATGVPDVEHHGNVTIRRYPPSGPFRRFAVTHTLRDGAVVFGSVRNATRGKRDGWRRRLRGLVPPRGRALVRRWSAVMRWVVWPATVRGWWATLARELPPADLYHACGTFTIAPALAGARRARAAGRRSVVVYDAVDNVLEGNHVLQMPRPLRPVNAARERRWARAADARTTVNDALATRLATRWGTEPPVSIPNYPEAWAAGDIKPDRIRSSLGLPPGMRIVLFQGRLSPNLGIDEAAEAVLRVDATCLVLLGFGRWVDRCRARDEDPRFAGRHFTLPPVHPDELAEWTASADAAVVALPPVSRNQRDSTPNKFWEALLVGTPIVLGPDLDEMARIVTELGAGVVAPSLEPPALADAIRRIVDRDPGTAAAERRRVADAAAARFTWSVAAARYQALVRALARREGIAGR